MKKLVHTSGKRKQAIARATIKEGKGKVRINKMMLDTYNPELARLRIMEPLLLAGEIAGKVNIEVNVKGGGWQAQAESARLAIAKGLVEYSGSKLLKQQYLQYDRHLMVSDVRRAESSKPNDSKPRKKRQKSYR